MKSLSKLLVPIDFSERSVGAGHYARMLADAYGSEIVLAHVVVPPHYEFGTLEIGGSMLAEIYAARTAQVQKDLAAFAAEHLSGMNVRLELLEGEPARRIVEFAHEEDIGLIVMPTHGYGSFRRFILGSVTAKVLHDANCPVWTGAHLEDARPVTTAGLGHILCAVDLGILTARTLSWAAGLQRQFGTRLTVVHAPAYSRDSESESGTDWRGSAESRVRDAMAEAGAGPPCPMDVVIEPGDPPKVICGLASEIGAGLLVIGRGSAAGVFGRLRTNAYAIIRQAPCPVVSV